MATSATGDMSRTWNELAERDPFHFVATSREDWTTTDFYDSGKDTAQAIIDWLTDHSTDALRGSVLEIGCGPGRTLIHFARHYDRAFGIDISSEMLDLARERHMPSNVELILGNGSNLRPCEDETIDLIYSGLVFQHIPSATVISEYLEEVSRVLRNTGHAILQFDTRPPNFLAALYKRLPDALLPRDHRRYIRRYRRDPQWLRATVRRAGLVILDERQEGTAEHYFMLARQREVPTNG